MEKYIVIALKTELSFGENDFNLPEKTMRSGKVELVYAKNGEEIYDKIENEKLKEALESNDILCSCKQSPHCFVFRSHQDSEFQELIELIYILQTKYFGTYCHFVYSTAQQYGYHLDAYNLSFVVHEQKYENPFMQWLNFDQRK
jgi:hypothetical protein